MAALSSFRAVYKKVEDQEIDVDIYVPNITNATSRCPVCM